MGHWSPKKYVPEHLIRDRTNSPICILVSAASWLISFVSQKTGVWFKYRVKQEKKGDKKILVLYRTYSLLALTAQKWYRRYSRLFLSIFNTLEAWKLRQNIYQYNQTLYPHQKSTFLLQTKNVLAKQSKPDLCHVWRINHKREEQIQEEIQNTMEQINSGKSLFPRTTLHALWCHHQLMHLQFTKSIL